MRECGFHQLVAEDFHAHARVKWPVAESEVIAKVTNRMNCKYQTRTGGFIGWFGIVILLIMNVWSEANVVGQRHFDQASQQQQWFVYETELVTVEGRLKVRMKYGAPNYGENRKTDEREYVPVLVLSSPINVRANTDDVINGTPVKHARVVQLVLEPGLLLSSKSFVGGRVLVTGTLFHAHTGHHHYEVLMSVQQIKRRLR